MNFVGGNEGALEDNWLAWSRITGHEKKAWNEKNQGKEDRNQANENKTSIRRS